MLCAFTSRVWKTQWMLSPWMCVLSIDDAVNALNLSGFSPLCCLICILSNALSECSESNVRSEYGWRSECVLSMDDTVNALTLNGFSPLCCLICVLSMDDAVNASWVWMTQWVRPEYGWRSEWRSECSHLEWFLPTVLSNMRPEYGWRSEGLAAVDALVRPLPAVNAHVFVETRRLWERLAAHAALVWSVLLMYVQDVDP